MNNQLQRMLAKTVLQPCCMNHCRDWRETAGGLPASNHAPTCDNYKTETFFKVMIKGDKGPYCVLETQTDVDDLRDDGELGEEYDVVSIAMTRDQFEHLDEFQGF